ncbi:hypothetical protein [Antarcticimicrobium sediminis]|nr:hypothetical protein [Antarcticimicrobium sediminis]
MIVIYAQSFMTATRTGPVAIKPMPPATVAGHRPARPWWLAWAFGQG